MRYQLIYTLPVMPIWLRYPKMSIVVPIIRSGSLSAGVIMRNAKLFGSIWLDNQPIYKPGVILIFGWLSNIT